MSGKKSSPLSLPMHEKFRGPVAYNGQSTRRRVALISAVASLLWFFWFSPLFSSPRDATGRFGFYQASQDPDNSEDVYSVEKFYHTFARVPDHTCPSVVPGTPSYSGYIGLQGDSEETPRRSFFWLVRGRSLKTLVMMRGNTI